MISKVGANLSEVVSREVGLVEASCCRCNASEDHVCTLGSMVWELEIAVIRRRHIDGIGEVLGNRSTFIGVDCIP